MFDTIVIGAGFSGATIANLIATQLNEEVVVIETNIDDCSGEVLGFTMEQLSTDYKQRELYNITYLMDWASKYKVKPTSWKISKLF